MEYISKKDLMEFLDDNNTDINGHYDLFIIKPQLQTFLQNNVVEAIKIVDHKRAINNLVTGLMMGTKK